MLMSLKRDPTTGHLLRNSAGHLVNDCGSVTCSGKITAGSPDYPAFACCYSSDSTARLQWTYTPHASCSGDCPHSMVYSGDHVLPRGNLPESSVGWEDRCIATCEYDDGTNINRYRLWAKVWRTENPETPWGVIIQSDVYEIERKSDGAILNTADCETADETGFASTILHWNLNEIGYGDFPDDELSDCCGFSISVSLKPTGAGCSEFATLSLTVTIQNNNCCFDGEFVAENVGEPEDPDYEHSWDGSCGGGTPDCQSGTVESGREWFATLCDEGI